MNTIGTEYKRPWGTYHTLHLSSGAQTKLICVRPGGVLSLQKHARRAEHWVVIKGLATIRVGDAERQHSAGSYVYIPKGELHRLANRGAEDVELIEVQVGDYLGEDDIVRLEDVYGRL